MDATTILNNLDNGTITRDSAIDLLMQHASRLYLIEAYLETRDQRTEWREKYWDALDETDAPHLPTDTIIDLIDHAFLTDHVGHSRATSLLIDNGMDSSVAFHHIETLQPQKDHDTERKNYLDDPEHAPRYCTRCGRIVTAKDVSNRGICWFCGLAAQADSKAQIKQRQGPYFRRWRDAILAFAYTLEDAEIAERRVTEPVTLGDLIDTDKYPGCDSECDLCPDTECPFRDTLSNTE